MHLDGNKSLYEVLGVDKEAPQAEIRKAYLKLAVQMHPDKNPDDLEASGRFQTLQKVYGILSDPEKRKIYDRTGSIEESEELNSDSFSNLYDYYKDMFAPVTEEFIDDFFDSYRGSAGETEEVLKYYEQFNGDMDKSFEWIMCSDPQLDSHRFKDVIEAAIKNKDVKKYPKFTAWAKKVAARPAPQDPLKKQDRRSKEGSKKRKSDKDSGTLSLVEQIRGKKKNGGGVLGASFLDQLQSKYGVKGGGGDEDEEGVEFGDEPTEEEFQAARERLEQRKNGGSGGGGGSKKSSGGGQIPQARKAVKSSGGGGGKKKSKK